MPYCKHKLHTNHVDLPESEFSGSALKKTTKYCKQCLSQKAAERYNQNKDKILLRNRQYYNQNKDRCVATQKQYREKHADELAQYRKSYYQQHRELLIQKVKQYSQLNPHVNRNASQRYRDNNKEQRITSTKLWRDLNKDITCYLANKRRAQKLLATPSWAVYEQDQIKALYAEAKRLTEETGIEYHVDHIVPLQHPLVCGLHCLDNLQILVGSINLKKSNTFLV